MKRQEKNEIYSIRKLKVGVGSALIGLSFLGTSGLINDVPIIKDVVGIHSVYAAEATPKPEGKVIAQGEDGVPWELYENGYLLFKPVSGKDTLSNNKGDTTWKREHGSKIKHVGFAGKVYAPEDSSALFSKDFLEKGIALKSLEFNPITLDVSNVDTSRVTNMQYMFFGLSNLTNLDVTKFNTSKVTDMGGMFANVSNLVNLDVTHFDTNQVTNMASMFSGMSKLTNLDVTKFDTSKVTSMFFMFYGLSNLTNLDVTNFDTSKVMNMESMFNGMSRLTNLDVTKFDTSKVTNMNHMFDSVSNLTSLDVTKFNTSKVTNMASMFYDMKNLTSLDVTKFDTSNVKNMRAMFYNLSNLNNLDVSKFNTSNVTNMEYMFAHMSKLISLDVKNFNTSKVNNMGYMFDNMLELTELDLTNFNTSEVTDIKGIFLNTTKLKELKLGDKFKSDGISTVTSNHDYGDQYTDKWYKANDKDHVYTVSDWAAAYGSNPKTTAGTWVREIANVPDKVEVIKSKVVYEKDPNREKGSENIVVKGKDGEDQIITTYVVDSKTGNVTPSVGKPVRTINPTETVIKVAAKDKVETIRKNGDTIERTTRYTVNPENGEITEETTDKLIASNGNGIKPPVVENNDFNGGVNGDLDGNSLLNEKPNFDLSKIKRPYLGTGLNDFGPKKESNKDNIQFVPINDNNHSNDNKIDSNIKEFKGSDKLDNEKPISKLPHTAGENNMVLNALGALTIATVLGVSISKYKKEN